MQLSATPRRRRSGQDRRIRPWLLLMAVTFLPACGGGARYSVSRVSVARTESERVRGFLDEAFLARLDRSPVLADLVGHPGVRNAWDDRSDDFAIETAALLRREAERAERGFSMRRLSAEEGRALRLLALEDRIVLDELAWRGFLPLLSTHHGLHREAPAHLLLHTRLPDLAAATAYVERIETLGPELVRVADELQDRSNRGVGPPRDRARATRDQVARLYVAPGELRAPLVARLEELTTIDDLDRSLLVRRARVALDGPVREGAARLIEALGDVADSPAASEGAFPEDGGLWRRPGGRDAYEAALRRATTTETTADEMHAGFRAEVARLHGDLRRLASRVDFAGDVEAFLDHQRSRPDLRHAPGGVGREAWLARVGPAAAAVGLEIRPLPGGLTPSRPELVCAPVGASSGAILYVDLEHPERLGPHRIDAFLGRYVNPGEHVARHAARANLDDPALRRFGRWVAWEDGWALYAMALARESGAIGTTWAEVGWVDEELLAFALGVVDTGIHAKKWSPDQAVRYLVANTAEREVDARHLVAGVQARPGLACAGPLALQRLRDLRQEIASDLEEDFDRDAFHEAVLRVGPVPLEILEPAVREQLRP